MKRRLEVGRDVLVERGDDALLDIIEQPARADDRKVGIGTGGDVGGQLLLQVVPRHHFDLDLGVGIGRFEGLGSLFEVGTRALAVLGDGDANRALGKGTRTEGNETCSSEKA